MIPTIVIERAPVQGIGTYGDLYFTDEHHKDEKVCHTLEREWLLNIRERSCLPDGEYWVEPHKSPKHGECYIIYNERNGVTKYDGDHAMRWGCLLHKENWCERLKGCIAPVTSFAKDRKDSIDGFNSTKAFDKLISLLNGRKAKLILKPKGCNWI